MEVDLSTSRSPRSRRHRRPLWLWEEGVPRRTLWRREGLWLAAMLMVLVASAWFHPDPSGLGTHQQIGLPPCSFLFFTGRPCPMCGMTTAFSAMAHLQFATAIHAHPFGALGFGGLVVYAGMVAFGLASGKRLHLHPGFSLCVALPFVIAIVIFGVARMLLWGR